MKVDETEENVGCEVSFGDFCTFNRVSDIYLGGKKMKSFMSKKISDFPNEITLYLYMYESKPGYIIGLETNEKDNSRTNIIYIEFSKIINTMKFFE